MDKLFTVYCAQTVSAETVLGMLEKSVGTNPNEERVLCYLRQYIGSINSDTLRRDLSQAVQCAHHPLSKFRSIACLGLLGDP